MSFPKCRLPDDEPDAGAGLSSERCLPLDSSVASDTPGARRPFDLQSQRTGVTEEEDRSVMPCTQGEERDSVSGPNTLLFTLHLSLTHTM